VPRADLSARAALVGCALALALGSALRLPGLATDLWLDEIWSVVRVEELHSPLGVFTSLHDSNNHYLQSLWLYVVGDASAWLLRLPSFLAGSATIAMAAALGWRRGRLEALLVAWLCALSFALVHFSSEARGYAAVVFFALAAQWTLESDLAAPRASRAALFGACVVAGLLAQLIFVFYWCAAAAWMLWRWRALPPRTLALRMLAWHALPLAAMALLYAVDLRVLVVGGGDPTDVLLLVAQAVGWTLGLPILHALAGPDALLALALVAGGLALRARRGDDSWIALALTLALPIAVFAWLRPQMIPFRYFLIGSAFALLLCADLAAAGLRAGGVRRAAAALALLLFAFGNAAHWRAFTEKGRGHFREALQTMARETPGDVVTVASDHDFRNRLVLQYYARELPDGKRLAYVPRDRFRLQQPEWLIRHAPSRPAQPAQQIAVDGTPYRLFAEYDHAAISGFYWALYRRQDAASDPR
jgi:4-amino-4-deoxy-L-arabinose transferase-like glycosyltransferase